jgi:GAF domain-containing protein
VADSPLTGSLAALSKFFVGDGTLQDTLTRVADLTVEAVEPAALAGITMIVEGRHRTAVFTDELSPEIDQSQYDSGQGPCLEAFRELKITQIQSTLQDGPWPEFRRSAAEHGIGSTASFPLVVNKTGIGALNLYARAEHAFNSHDIETASLFASQAAIVLANAQAYWDARELSSGLSEAMKHRAVIEQAKGMLMATQGCDEDTAFDMFTRASQRENVKLRDIARRIVAEAIARGRDSQGPPYESPSHAS